MSGGIPKRFDVTVRESVSHVVQIEIEDAEGDASAGYVSDEVLNAVCESIGNRFSVEPGDIDWIVESDGDREPDNEPSDYELEELNIALAEYMSVVHDKPRTNDAQWDAHDNLTRAVARLIVQHLDNYPPNGAEGDQCSQCGGSLVPGEGVDDWCEACANGPCGCCSDEEVAL